MLNFQAFRSKEITLTDLVAGLTPDDLRKHTDEMVDTIRRLIANCVDGDVTFQPVDPAANDPFAADPAELKMAWTLGHVIVHTTSSAEEAAALAAELARGVEHHGRSRYEVPWRTVHTIAECRDWLEESRRMRLASLGMWPVKPHLDNVCAAWTNGPQVNAAARFVLGLMHDDGHLAQIADIVRQARVARGA